MDGNDRIKLLLIILQALLVLCMLPGAVVAAHNLMTYEADAAVEEFEEGQQSEQWQ